MRTPVTSLSSEDSLGKRPTTRVRFLIWPLTFSQPLVLQYFRHKAVPGLSYTAQFSAALDDFSNTTNLPVGLFHRPGWGMLAIFLWRRIPVLVDPAGGLRAMV